MIPFMASFRCRLRGRLRDRLRARARTREGLSLAVIAVIGLLACGACCAEPNEADQAYIKLFTETFHKVDPPPALEAYASAARYDDLYMGEKLDAALANVSNDSGGIAWGLSYRMRSLNEMFRATKDLKYLDANLKCVRAVVAVTDDKIGKKLFTDRVVAAWGCDKYAERGRAVFAVHTGIIAAQIIEFLRLSKENAPFKEKLGDEFNTIQSAAMNALAVHDRQWREGPEAGAGYYIGMDQENALENKPLPGNRLSAMGWALWFSWKLTGNTVHRDRALAIGHYVKNRLTPSPDGAYFWPYWLPLEPVTAEAARESISGEDSSHAGLTLELPLVLAADNEVFTKDDLQRFAKTFLNGIARLGNGILLGDITGKPTSKPNYVGHATNWLPLAKVNAELRDRLVPFYLNYQATPGPCEMSSLMLYGKP